MLFHLTLALRDAEKEGKSKRENRGRKSEHWQVFACGLVGARVKCMVNLQQHSFGSWKTFSELLKVSEAQSSTTLDFSDQL